MDKPSSRDPRATALRALEAFHSSIDARADQLASRHRDRLQCRRGCSACCVDDLTVFQVEAARIRAQHTELLRTADPHDRGACAFLDAEGACRVYGSRPYVCRTQGLPLRWFEDTEGGETLERRDICPLNEAGTPVERLEDADCWLIGPAEGELFDIARRYEGEAPSRIALRSLFERSEAE